MIVAERKPFEEIKQELLNYKKILILGCGTCVSVCMAGGEKEVQLLATELRMAAKLAGKEMTVDEMTVQRQCDREYVEAVAEKAGQYDAVLSMACGAGVQFVARMLEPLVVKPALNTRFIGVAEAEGVWAERCRACGNCLLAEYGGICPVTMCSKGLLNGPCGGSKNDKCEASQEKDCAWVLIYKRLKAQGRLDNIRKFANARNYQAQANPAKQVNEAYVRPELETAKKK